MGKLIHLLAIAVFVFPEVIVTGAKVRYEESSIATEPPVNITCNANETLVECPETMCNVQYCSQLGSGFSCAAVSCSGSYGCICKNGYLRNSEGVCIPLDQCPSPCQANEVVSSCANGGCRRRKCSDLDRAILCIDPRRCEPGCICAKGFYKNEAGNCVTEEQCRIEKIKCTKPNEVYDVCPATCPFRVCGIDDRLIDCIPPPRPGDPNCNKPACRCKNGFYRDDKGNCVTWENCPKCTKPNEEYDPCAPACPRRTCDFDPKVVKCSYEIPQIGSPLCVVGCRCKDGYLRNAAGICVPKDECNACGGDPNAKPGCGTYCGKKCTDIGKKGPFPCPRVCFKDKCDCKDGFYFDSNTRRCVRPEECSGCGGDPNAKPGCGTYCDKRCSDVGKKYTLSPRVRCPHACFRGKCDCKDGFYYDSNRKRCVRPEECTPTCKLNEVFVECPEGACSPKTCKDVGFPIPCPDIIKCPSKPGCICAGGYVRNSKGVCIPASKCPSCGGDKNAHVGCGTNCGKKCSDLGKTGPFDCPVGCSLYGCDCNDGFYYDEDKGKCVPPSECPGPSCYYDDDDDYYYY